MKTRPARVLVIDDEPANVALLRSLLAKAGISAVEATTDSRQAAHLTRHFEPDLILLDLHMPHLDGYAVLEQLSSLTSGADGVPVLVLTADITMEARQRALALGARDFVSKPFTLNELVLRIGNLVDSRLSHVELSRQVSVMRSNIESDAKADAELRRLHCRVQDTIDRKAITLVYQPIIDTGDGSVVGYEALARFATPPIETPDTWFHNARLVGLGPHLELATLDLAIADLAAIGSDCYLAVNISETTLRSPALADHLRTADPTRLVLELEGKLPIVDLHELARSLDRLRELGLRVATDETATAGEGLRVLLALQPEIIKIDRVLVEDLERDPRRQALVAGLVAFAAEAGSTLAAEGVETQGELTALRSLGVGLAQGYLIARPGPLPAHLVM